MGKVFIKNTSGEEISHAYFSADIHDAENAGGELRLDEFKNDGVINDLEIRDARIQLERVLNTKFPFQGPRGVGGGDLLMQPWRIQETEVVETPDGFSMPITVRMEERYLGSSGWWIFQPEEKVSKEVIMTMRWERGAIRLYQCDPPPYNSTPPSSPNPTHIHEAEESGEIASSLTSLYTFLFGEA